MKQPDLGKKILELRLAKGLTQGELAEKCNLSLRTIQRIESAEVSPRSYTVKMIFSNLDYQIYDSFGRFSYRLDRTAYRFLIRLGQFFKYVMDLFNLKTDTMRKVTTLSIVLLGIVLGLTSLTSVTKAQSASKVREIIENSNNNFIKWFNQGDIDSLTSLYRYDACLVGRGCGKAFIKDYYEIESSKYKFEELTVISLSVSDSIAVEKGKWRIVFATGQKIGGEYLTEWRRSDKKWLMVNDLSITSNN